MQPHELFKDILKKTSAKQIASDLGVSLSLVYKWSETPGGDTGSGSNASSGGSGSHNPLARVGQLIASTGDIRLAQWVCQQAGGFFIHNPEAHPNTRPLAPATSKIVEEFAEMLSLIAAASADQKVTPEEAASIRARWEQLKSVTEGYIRAAETGTFHPPESTH
ncbi:hypothetical protein Ga0100231_018825 [Opitutaceae bacterium TAV4]|uniref:phage regulatory CII family protein n=1 Tax=Geminisphaera colitermitum TaxID=1148786 RepID=UPI000158CE5C|nr:phage regulatory CII family protein [Geminisphaera colitermitum]RRJ96006.1 hypothetical protein Ga0100231_018825 [Opitutaceae bacterium TAV4]RRK00153.1 hypothetical protein Ga0100230_019490 [Opitutaceae bacterium TAV3]